MASIISILVLTLVFLTINPISADVVDDICAQTKDPDYCAGVFYGFEDSNIQTLAQYITNYTYVMKVIPIVKKIEILLPQTKDAQLKEVYSLCKNYFSAALSSLSAANTKLQSHDYLNVKMGVDAFSRDVASCKKTFSSAPSKRIEIFDDSENFEDYLDILVVTVGKL